ncbi:MAG: hypothetical protein AAF990_23730 [Bacteroidota bacterium]
MYSSTLIRVFSRLSKRDVRELGKFVASPYFNQRQDVVRLFEYLAAHSPLKAQKVVREKLFAAIYPGETFQIQQLRYVMSFLMNLIRKYFQQAEFESQPILQQQQLCQALRRRGEGSLFQKEITNWQKLQEAHPLRNTHHHYYNYQRFYELYQFESQRSRKGDTYLQERFEELTTFYLSNTLLHGCATLTQQNILKKDFHLKLLPQVLAQVEQEDYSEIPAIAIYYHAYQALKDPDNDFYFNNLKHLIHQHWQQFSENEALDIFLIAVNYCIQRLNKGDTQYVREAFELYRSGVENGTFLQNGILSDHTYKNIIRLGISLKEFDWIAQFQESYKDRLDPLTGENAYKYNLAYYHFQRSEYDLAIPLLQQVEFKDAFSNFDTRRMLLRIYYEQGEYDALESLLDSFYTYIQRQKNIGYHRENYLHLIRFVRKLLRTPTQAGRHKLRQTVEATSRIAEREWLLQMIGGQNTN